MALSQARRVLGVTAFALIVGCTSAPTSNAPTSDSAGEVIHDTEITSRVTAALSKDPGVYGWKLQVRTVQGAVHLSGFVQSIWDKERADEIARDVAGVKSVRNDLIVRAGSRLR